ncbi:MAG: 30S ribosomal protein S6e [Candidatus Aenigmatarchaeota archaeon]
MPTFKFVIRDKQKSWQVEKDQKECPVFNRKIGDSIDGGFLGLNGYELSITGGSDKDGFPMRSDVDGIVKKKILITKGVGFRGMKRVKKKHFEIDGMRKRKLVRGNAISADTIQINCKITKAGEKPIGEIFDGGKESEEKKDETENKK